MAARPWRRFDEHSNLSPAGCRYCGGRDALDTEYWEAAKRHELVVQRCNACQASHWARIGLLPVPSFDLGCRKSPAEADLQLGGIWHPVHPALKEACPYLVVLVELSDAGTCAWSATVCQRRAAVNIGAEVEAVFEDHEDEGVTLVQWRVV